MTGDRGGRLKSLIYYNLYSPKCLRLSREFRILSINVW